MVLAKYLSSKFPFSVIALPISPTRSEFRCARSPSAPHLFRITDAATALPHPLAFTLQHGQGRDRRRAQLPLRLLRTLPHQLDRLPLLHRIRRIRTGRVLLRPPLRARRHSAPDHQTVHHFLHLENDHLRQENRQGRRKHRLDNHHVRSPRRSPPCPVARRRGQNRTTGAGNARPATGCPAGNFFPSAQSTPVLLSCFLYPDALTRVFIPTHRVITARTKSRRATRLLTQNHDSSCLPPAWSLPAPSGSQHVPTNTSTAYPRSTLPFHIFPPYSPPLGESLPTCPI